MKIYTKTTILLFTISAFLTVSARTTRLEQGVDMKTCQRWVDSVYDSMTEKERIGQLVFPKVVPTQGANSRAAIKRLVENGNVGGLLFTEGSIAQYVEMTNYAQQLSKVPLMMTFDGEWGLAMRIKETERFPNNMAIGAAKDAENLAYLYGKEMGRQSKAIGIHVNFAPVADVNSNASNPVIGYRSFGEDAESVSRLVNAYSRGLEESGVQAVAKHFPGHGDTNSDSHKTLPAVDKTLAQLEQTELVPFRSFINDGGSGIMTAHLMIKALDTSGQPMSLSKKAHHFLRNDLGFEGLVYTDALGMRGATSVDGENSTLAALKAGADVLLSPVHPLEDINAILTEVKAGKISKGLIEDRCKRVLTYKYLLGLASGVPQLNLQQVESEINSTEAVSTNQRISASVFTALKNNGDILPIGNLSNRKIAVVTPGLTAENVFVDMCRRYADVKVYGGNITAETIKELKEFDDVIVLITKDKATTKAQANQLSALDNVISVFLVNPYKMSGMAQLVRASKAVILGYDDTAPLRKLAAQAVFGGIEVNGRLPVTLKGLFDKGSGIDLPKTRLGYTAPSLSGMKPELTDSIDAIMARALKSGAVPGAHILVARHGNVVLDKSYGKLTAGGDPVEWSTLYDLASVSKAIGTLPGIMVAVDKGYMDIEAPLSDYAKGLRGTGKDSLLVKEFLFHETGMPAALNMFTTMMDTATYSGNLTSPRRDVDHTILIQKGLYGHKDARLRSDIIRNERTEDFPIEMAEGLYVGKATVDTIMNRIYNIGLRPTKKYNYSCLNFSLLMEGEQGATGIPHQQWCDSLIWAPLGAWTMGYRPSERFPKKVIAPTERDNYLRKQLIHGYVHDEMADFLGGVSGNAGLFANAEDIAKICQMWLNGGTYGGVTLMSPETVNLFTTTVSPTCYRGLGFDKPSSELVSPFTYGHTGFTGPSFWVDPEKEVIFVFLTNRVNPTRDNEAFAKSHLRPDLLEQVMLSVIDDE